MQYTYEFEMWRGEKEWCIVPFGIAGATQGADVEDACESAADLLRETVQDYLMRGEQPPAPTFDNTPEHGGVRVVVSVDASLDGIEKISASKAAEMLGVSRGRITAMVVGSVHAGEFSEPDEYQDAQNVAIPQFLLDQDPDTYVLLTEGDCMSKAFGEGQQHLAVSPHAEAHDGSIVVVRIDDGDLLVRRLRLSINGRRLCADSYNPDYEDIVVPYDSGRRVDLAGVVKWNQSAGELE